MLRRFWCRVAGHDLFLRRQPSPYKTDRRDRVWVWGCQRCGEIVYAPTPGRPDVGNVYDGSSFRR